MNRFEANQEREIFPSADPRGNLVLRVANSECFHRSPRLREILLYVCQKTIENHLEEVREQKIGHAVFGRRPDYNPGDDNIVRVEARNLRKRLDDYFTSEGRDESIVITIPKGSYVPRFEVREIAPTIDEVLSTVTAMPELETEAQPRSVPPLLPERNSPAWFRWSVGALTTLCGLLALSLGVCLWLLEAKASAMRPAPRLPFWASLFNEDQTLVICADSAWVLRQDALGMKLSLDDYLSSNWTRSYTEESVRDPVLRVLRTKQYTSMADVRVIERLLLTNRFSWNHTAIKSSRNVQARDFKTGNVIIVGSGRAVPWEELFRDQLNFWADYDLLTRAPVILNKHPLAGEPAVYRNSGSGTQLGNAYSAIAYLPNVSHTGNVLIIAGASMEGCEAAGEYLTDPKVLTSLLRRFGTDPNKPPPYFEVVLNSGTLAGASQESKVMAYRIWKNKE